MGDGESSTVMDDAIDFEERLAARLLGVPVDADARAVSGRFRSLVKAVHPDRTLLQGCVDLGSLAEARDLLLARAARRVDREAGARGQLAAMRLAPRAAGADAEDGSTDRSTDQPTENSPEVAHSARGWRPRRSMVTEVFEAADSVGTLIDLAG